MRCTVCGQENPNYAVVCGQCGEFLPKEDLSVPHREGNVPDPDWMRRIRCPRCRSVNDRNSTVCARCGMPISDASDSEASDERKDVPVSGVESEIKAAPDSNAEGERKDAPVAEAGIENHDVVAPEAGIERKAASASQAETESKIVPAYNAGGERKSAPKTVQEAKRKVRCRSCWRDNPATAAVCEYCGRSLHPAFARAAADEAFETLARQKNAKITCVNCGKEVPWNTLTCDGCGKHPRVFQLDDYADDEGIDLIGALVDYMRGAHSQEDGSGASDPERRGSWDTPEWAHHSSAVKVRCRKCYEFNPRGAGVCQYCGARLPSEVKTLDDGSRICNCGYRNLPGVTVCLKCKGMVMKKCPDCGQENPVGADTCGNCGKILEQ